MGGNKSQIDRITLKLSSLPSSSTCLEGTTGTTSRSTLLPLPFHGKHFFFARICLQCEIQNSSPPVISCTVMRSNLQYTLLAIYILQPICTFFIATVCKSYKSAKNVVRPLCLYLPALDSWPSRGLCLALPSVVYKGIFKEDISSSLLSLPEG